LTAFRSREARGVPAGAGTAFRSREARGVPAGAGRAALVLFAIALAILLAPSHAEVGRAAVAEGYAERVVAAGLLELPPATPAPVRDGRRVGEVGPLDVAIALPGALMARIGPDGPDAGVRRALGGVLFSWLLFATVGSVFFARLSRARGLGLPTGVALLATAALLLGTSVLWAARRADATLIATLALLLLLDELDASVGAPARHAVQLCVLGATLALAHPAFAGCALALAVLDAGRRAPPGRRVLLGLAMGVPILGAAALGRMWDLRAALATPSSGAPMHALFGLLLSTGRGLFVYSPVALLGLIGFSRLWGRARGRAQAIAVALVTALLGIATRADWHGDPAFGPPLLIPLLPLLLEPAALLCDASGRGKLAFSGLAIAGLLLQLLGLSVQAEAWPRVVAEVRAATGAPGWFLDPAADIEFVPQLSPVVGQWTLARLALGAQLPSDPPFSLVVGSDQAETARPPSVETAWAAVRGRIDRASLRPNLALAAGGARLIGLQLAAAGIAFAIATVLALGRRAAKEDRWRRG
jgi:hypothetical protein